MDQILHNVLNFQKHDFFKVFVVYWRPKEKKRGPHIIIINLRTVPCNDVVQLGWKCYIKIT